MRKRILLLLAVVLTTLTTLAKNYNFEVDGIYYKVLSSKDLTCEVTYQTLSDNPYSGDIVIPSTVDYNGKVYSVTVIGSQAFENSTNLISVVIPNSVTTIGYDAFRCCSSLKSVEIPNSVTAIGVGAFSLCSSLTSVVIGNSVTEIVGGAFEKCTSLTSVVIPESVTTIGSSAFSCCRSLTSVEIPNSVTEIGNWAFSYCSGLTSVVIPNSVTEIGSAAFFLCGLASVVIGNSVTEIGDNAFSDCSSLMEITSLNTTPPSIQSLNFYNVDKEKCVLKVPAEAIEAYKSADYWKEFLNIEGIDIPTSINSIATAATSGKTYTINGAIVSEGYKGIVIRNGKKFVQGL